MRTISILEKAGAFAENKDVARALRLGEILPALEKGEEIVIDFAGVGAATQAFVHVLISDALRTYGDAALDRMAFKSCDEDVKKIINIVVQYMQ